MCGRELVIGTNWTEAKKEVYDYICKSCKSNYDKDYGLENKDKKNNREKLRYKKEKEKKIKYQKGYYSTHKEKRKEYTRKYNKEHSEWKREYNKNYLAKHKDEIVIRINKWRKTDSGRESRIKSNTRRKRELGWNKIMDNPFPEEIEIEWHHIDNKNVVAIPKYIHQKYIGYQRKKHRELLESYVKKIYGDI